MGAIEYPTAREVAVTIVAAARIYDDDPVLTIEGVPGARGRWLAIAVLSSAFHLAPIDRIAKICGVSASSAGVAKQSLKEKRRSQWWKDGGVEVVERALAVATAETDAEIRDRVTAAVANPAAVNDDPLPGTGGDADPAPITEINETSAFSPLFGGLKSDVLDVEVPDFSHLRDAHDRSGAVADSAPKSVSVAARSLADFQRARIIKTTRGRIIDHRQEGMVDLGDPLPGRSALDQRGAS